MFAFRLSLPRSGFVQQSNQHDLITLGIRGLEYNWLGN
ncbi:putative uncharacterized phage protein [Aliivibrio wodanis]|uniref:Uncharacterized phage protein n=1 Tax=Aliivibrio wodanis TaxID=80852 RepID=A0A090KIK6_9GAMM|nr:putative uncharacterized phage protein [Aliivibrio wodanis]